MSDEIIDGEWDDLISRYDFHGRKVRIIVLHEQGSEGRGSGGKAWLTKLRSWAEGHKPIGHPIDDSRESVYSGTVDDPR